MKMMTSLSSVARHCARPTLASLIARLSSRAQPSLTVSPSSVTVAGLSSEPAQTHSFPYVWLRDSCPCPRCIHPGTRQKLHSSSDVPLDIRPASGEGAITIGNEGLRVKWGARLSNRADIDFHESVFPIDFLQDHATPASLHALHQHQPRIPWTGSSLLDNPDSSMSYSTLCSSPRALLAAITHLTRYGILFVTDVPGEETSDDKCEVKKLAEMFGEIRGTMYGKLWDVRSRLGSTNIAFTDLHLGLHMDISYVLFSNQPTYIFFNYL